MAKHAKPKRHFSKPLMATGSVIAVSAAPLMFFSAPVAGSTICSDLVAGKSGATAETLSNNVCQLSFTLDASVEIPSWVTKLSVVAIGGGGLAVGDGNGYAGGGGQFVSFDDVSLVYRSLNIGVGIAGASTQGPGDSFVENQTTMLVDAKGAPPGSFGGSSAFEYAVDGTNTSVLAGDKANDSFATAAGGTKSAASYPNGGSGLALKSVRDGTNSVPGQYLDSNLWAIDSEILGAGTSLLDFEFGEGGSISATPIDATNLPGRGGSINVAGDQVGAAGAGIVVMRFSLDSAPTLQTEPETEPEPVTVAYSGPIPVKLSSNCVFDIGGETILSGIRLDGVYEASVNGQEVEVLEASEESVDLRFPALEAGIYDVIYKSKDGVVTHQNGLKVCATAQSVEPEENLPESGEEPANGFYVAERFTNYRGDRDEVIDSDRKAITEFVEANPGIRVVTCLGSTSGVPAIETDEALALARAENACSIVKELVPDVETKIASSTGVGVGQWYRAVSIFARGLFD